MTNRSFFPGTPAKIGLLPPCELADKHAPRLRGDDGDF